MPCLAFVSVKENLIHKMVCFQQGEAESHSTDRKSNNPFDLPYDSELEESNMVNHQRVDLSVVVFLFFTPYQLFLSLVATILEQSN